MVGSLLSFCLSTLAEFSNKPPNREYKKLYMAPLLSMKWIKAMIKYLKIIHWKYNAIAINTWDPDKVQSFSGHSYSPLPKLKCLKVSYTIARQIYKETKATVLILQYFFISRKNRKVRVKFAKMHLHWSVEEWRKILFADESKFNLKGSDSKHKCVRRPPNKRFPKYCKRIVKQDDGNVIVFWFFSLNEIGPLYEISETMDRYLCKNILETVMLIGHNNPINGFQPAATHPSNRLCSLRANASWLH